MNLVWNHERVWGCIGIWIFRRDPIMFLDYDQWMEEIYVNNVWIVDHYLIVYKGPVIGWQEWEHIVKSWFGILRIRRSVMWFVQWRLKSLYWLNILRFIWRLISQNQGINMAIDKECNLNSSDHKGLLDHSITNPYYFIIFTLVWSVKQYRTAMVFVVVVLDIKFLVQEWHEQMIESIGLMIIAVASKEIPFKDARVWFRSGDLRRKYKNFGWFGIFNVFSLKLIRSCLETFFFFFGYSWSSLVLEHKLNLVWLNKEQILRIRNRGGRLFWTKWYSNCHQNEGLRQCERDLCRGDVFLFVVLVWWSWGFGIVGFSGGIKPESLRSYEQYKYFYI